MGLNAIGLQLDVIGVNVAPFGLRVTADVLLLGEALPFTFVAGKLGGRANAGLVFTVPGELITKLINKLLGSAGKAVELFQVIELDFTLATGAMDLSKTPVLQPTASLTSIPKGITFIMKAHFDPNFPNSFTHFMSKVFPGTFTMMASFDGNALSISLDIPAIQFNKNVRTLLVVSCIGVTIVH